jgi:putative chitinase
MNIEGFVPDKYRVFFQETCERFQISADRAPYFLSTLLWESNRFKSISENLYYSNPKRLMQVWPKRFTSLGQASLYIKNPQKLANFVYGNRPDLGNIKPGDGWIFRGAGWIQLTGRSNFDRVGKALGLDLVNSPNLARDPQNAFLISGHFWQSNGLNELADKGDFKAIIKKVNGGLTGYKEREALLNKILNS